MDTAHDPKWHPREAAPKVRRNRCSIHERRPQASLSGAQTQECHEAHSERNKSSPRMRKTPERLSECHLKISHTRNARLKLAQLRGGPESMAMSSMQSRCRSQHSSSRMLCITTRELAWENCEESDRLTSSTASSQVVSSDGAKRLARRWGGRSVNTSVRSS